jgi:hypothetical protein
MTLKNRLEREARTLQVMFLLYCRQKHGSQSGLCKECLETLDYSLNRLKLCRFQQGKVVCAKCPVHCYKPEMRSRIKQVMRYSGPHMFLTYPILTLYHFLDSLRKAPQE